MQCFAAQCPKAKGVYMSNLPNHTVELLEQDPEVKSFIYQQIVDLEPFVTEKTVVAFIAKDAKKLASRFEQEGIEMKAKDLKKLHRIAIVLSEDGTQIEAEAYDIDIFQAIAKAKEAMVTQLIQIQENVISQQERIAAINQLLQNPQVH